MQIKYDIYEPAEDTYLLFEEIKKYSKGDVLEMGTGSGILAVEATKTAENVIGLDLNKDAIIQAEERYKEIKNLKFIYSDIFSCFKDIPDSHKFDLIIFNPPYLPEDPREPESSKLATTGGKKGWEILEKFFSQVNTYLKDDGKILFLFSSLTKKEKVHLILEKYGLDFKKISEHQLFYEKLYVYLAEKSDILKDLENKNIKNISMLAKGHRGVIFTGDLNSKKIAAKIQRKDIDVTTSIKNEARWLKLLNRKNIGPRLIEITDDHFIYEFVEGIFIPEYLSTSSKTEIKKVLVDIFNQCYTMDNMNANKEEMHKPYKHIIINKDKKASQKPVLIDFERMHTTEKPKNVTQFCQYISNTKILNILKTKGFIFKKSEITSAAKRYKQEISKENLKKIIDIIR